MKGFIYIIRSHQTDDVYYGSTTQKLCKRMAQHRCGYKKWLDGNINYVSSYEIVKYIDAYIELVECIDFQNKQELYAREGHHIRESDCVNKKIAGRSKKEYTTEYNNENREKHKQYREENDAKIKEYQQKYREEHKESNAEYQKKYCETNKETLAEYKKKYREANKDKINKYFREYRAIQRANLVET